MGKIKPYLLVEATSGTFKWYLPTTNFSTLSLTSHRYGTYEDFIEGTEQTNLIDYSNAMFYITNVPPRSDHSEDLSNFNLFDINVNDTWKIGNITGTWSVSQVQTNRTNYELQLINQNNRLVATLQHSVLNEGSTPSDDRLSCPFIYDISTGLIMYNGDLNRNGVWLDGTGTNRYRFLTGGRLSLSVFTTSTQYFKAGYPDIPYDEEVTPSDDPYGPDSGGTGYSGSGGGPAPTGGTGTTGNGGLHDDTSDAIPTPSTPSDVVVSSGLFTAYNPDASQLASFANALWNMQVSDINDVLRFLFGGDAFNAVIGLHLLPVSPSTGGSSNIKLGNWDTGVTAPKITSQYVQVPFGSLLLPEYWGNCIDYAPYTKIQLALPYIGIVDVDTDDVLGSTNTLTYNIDVLSGAICATLHCVKFNLSSVIYQWSGACAVSLPFSGASYNSVLSAIAGIAAAGMGFAAMAAGPIGAALPAAALAAGGGAFGAGSAASIMGTMKGKVQKSGSFGANSGALGIMTPYFILTRPVQSVPASWQADKGYPSNISAQLGTVIGYTEVSEINLECSGTEAEKKEIIDLLKKGVLF